MAQAKERDTNLELFRIILMIAIIAHHYVVNSGVIEIMREESLSGKLFFLYFIGAWGKTAINCFVMITGYYMCKSNVRIKKVLTLFLQVKFYSIGIYVLFCIAGYETLSLTGMLDRIVPIHRIETNFTDCFLVFYLLIPILNILTKNMNRKQHEYLLAIIGIIYVGLGTIKQVKINYVSWFAIVYFIAAYIRIYPREIYANKQLWRVLSLAIFLLGGDQSSLCS